MDERNEESGKQLGTTGGFAAFIAIRLLLRSASGTRSSEDVRNTVVTAGRGALGLCSLITCVD